MTVLNVRSAKLKRKLGFERFDDLIYVDTRRNTHVYYKFLNTVFAPNEHACIKRGSAGSVGKVNAERFAVNILLQLVVEHLEHFGIFPAHLKAAQQRQQRKKGIFTAFGQGGVCIES